MKIKVKIFGQLTDITREAELTFDGIADTDSLITELNRQYPAMAAAKFILAVDKKTTWENVLLNEGNVVALLPPFSGG